MRPGYTRGDGVFRTGYGPLGAGGLGWGAGRLGFCVLGGLSGRLGARGRNRWFQGFRGLFWASEGPESAYRRELLVWSSCLGAVVPASGRAVWVFSSGLSAVEADSVGGFEGSFPGGVGERLFSRSDGGWNEFEWKFFIYRGGYYSLQRKTKIWLFWLYAMIFPYPPLT